jgi:hypothetical protein
VKQMLFQLLFCFPLFSCQGSIFAKTFVSRRSSVCRFYWSLAPVDVVSHIRCALSSSFSSNFCSPSKTRRPCRAACQDRSGTRKKSRHIPGKSQRCVGRYQRDESRRSHLSVAELIRRDRSTFSCSRFSDCLLLTAR